MEQTTTYTADVYWYTRPLKSSEKAGVAIGGNLFKHWGLMIHYKDKDEEEGLPGRFIYEANDRKGKLLAEFTRFKKKDESVKGAELELVNKDKPISKKRAEEFCHSFNQQNKNYNLTKNNCQEFVNDMLVELSLLPCTGFRRLASPFSASSQSVFVSSGKVVDMILTSMAKNGPDLCKYFGEALRSLGVKNGNLIANECIERILTKKLAGIFNWWQLFQIVAEVLVRELSTLFFEHFKFDPEATYASAFACGKLASLGTAVVVGALTCGVGPSVLFWFVCEIVVYVIRKVRIFLCFNLK